MSTKCPKGKIYRKGYSRKLSSGKYIKIKPNCIVAQSQSNKKMVDVNKKIMASKKKSHKIARQLLKVPKCFSKKGEILREGYIRNSYKRSNSKKIINATVVPPTCIQSRTGRSKGKQLFVLEPNVLHKYGYYDVINLSKNQRHTALHKALLKIKPLSLARRLNGLYLLNRNTNTKVSKIFKEDEKWLKTTDKYINRTKIEQINKIHQ